MKLKPLVLSTFLTCLFGAMAWLYFNRLMHDAIPIETTDAVPGHIFAYSITFPFDNLNAVSLEIRRMTSINETRHNIGSVNGGLEIAHEDADMMISTSLISSPEIRNGILVSTFLLEIDDIFDEMAASDEWTIAGKLEIPGVSSKLSPKSNFLRGDSMSIAWERNPRWRGDEICIGRFRTHDENQIYDYNCVVVASSTDMR